MKFPRIVSPAMMAISIVIFSGTVSAQFHTYTPQSSLPQLPDRQGNPMFHTNIGVLVPDGTRNTVGEQAVQPAELPPFPGYLFEIPASLACIYGLAPILDGCNPNVTTTNPDSGSRAIALVDAYDDPTAVSDLATFTTQFGLPAADLTVVFANGTRPGLDPTGGWELEEALDVEYSHAMAPHAKLFLVESPDNNLLNLFAAVEIASNLVAQAGGGEVSMSWGGPEFPFETAYDLLLTTPGVVYFASAGDSPGTEYPSASPDVVSAGGTSLSSDLATGNFLLENSWQDSGGGPSLYERRPGFQDSVKNIVGKSRGLPDLSFDSNPNSGVWVYDTNPNPQFAAEYALGTGWYVVGGTSVASASLAGIVNAAGKFRKTSREENRSIYANMKNVADYSDIVYGNCGPYVGYFTFPGYDLCTGVGSPHGLTGK